MNQSKKGTLYIRDNFWYRLENLIKLGIASFAKDRSNTYITGEVERGEYIRVYEIPLEKMILIDKLLKNYFKKYNVYKGGGTEFYDRCIIDLIEPYLQSLNIEYRVLTKEEINTMERCERVRTMSNRSNIQNIMNNLNFKKVIQRLRNKRTNKKTNANANIDVLLQEITLIEPSQHQQIILEMIEGFFDVYNIGKIVWACGLGKALLSILIVNILNFKSIVIGVPSNNLQKQMKREILKIFPTKENILFVGGENDDEVKSTTNRDQIISFLDNTRDSQHNNKPKFIITTYHSCYLLTEIDIETEFKIGDEAHHLVGLEKEETKGFRLFHKIKSKKTLFMTATEKFVETNTNKEKYSMEDEAIFGKYIDIKSVHWAIENKKITDYNILVLKNTEDEVDEIINNLKISVCNKEIFISCYMCLKSFEKYSDLTHLLLYTNTTEDSEQARNYINEILSLNILSISKERIYNNALHSKNCNDLNSEVNTFKNMPYGIISCVYIFGEGFDLPKLNGICIAGNMQSETRIVQYILRPNRLEIGNPNKKAYVIIPYIDSCDWETENKSYEKVRNIVSQMRNVDENIEQKIFASICPKRIEPRFAGEKRIIYDDFVVDFEENESELSKIKLRLRYSKALGSKFTEEQDEYNYVRSINGSLHIQSKKSYNESASIHSNFIASPEDYFKAKGVWINWYHFMCFNTENFIKGKYEWIYFCKEKKIVTLEGYYDACELYEVLPKDPADFYMDFTNISNELGFNKNRRRTNL
jgi:superfamily II DNA or RNA helicase